LTSTSLPNLKGLFQATVSHIFLLSSRPLPHCCWRSQMTMEDPLTSG